MKVMMIIALMNPHTVSDKESKLNEDWESYHRRSSFVRNPDSLEIGRTGIKYLILKEGVGEVAGGGKTAIIDYVVVVKGEWSVLDSTIGEKPLKFDIGKSPKNGGVIDGVSIGVANMKKNEKRIISIPPNLAYGGSGSFGLKSNAVLIFEIELVDFFPCEPNSKTDSEGRLKPPKGGTKIF